MPGPRADIGSELADPILKYLFSISDINSVESSPPIARRVPPHASLAYRCASRRTREQTILAIGARRTVSSCEQFRKSPAGRSRRIANSRESLRPSSETQIVFHVEHRVKLRRWILFVSGHERREDGGLVDCGPHFLCGAALSVRNYWPDCGFIPLVSVPGSIHSWFALFDLRFALQLCPQDGNLDSLTIWFSEITVRGVIFHFDGSMPPLMSSISCICAAN